MAYRFKATIHGSQIQGTQSNFPVLISDLVSSIPAAFFAAITNAGGLDIKVVGMDGNEYSREITFVDAGNKKIELWVKVPSMTNGVDFSFWVYAGTPTTRANDVDVWSNGYYLRNSLNEAAGNIGDSTGHYTGTPNSLTYGATGKIQKGIGFNDVNDNISFGNVTQMLAAQQITVSLWLLQDAIDTNSQFLIRYVDMNRALFAGTTATGALRFAVYSSSTSYIQVGDYSPFINAGEFALLHFVFDGSLTGNLNRGKIYINGVSRADVTFGTMPAITSPEASAPYCLGSNFASNILGRVDEHRMNSQALSQQWIETEYANQSNPDTFLAASNGSTVAPVINTVTPNKGGLAGGGTAVLSGTCFGVAQGTVTIGGAAATVTAWSDTEIEVTVPAHAAGAVNVVVTSYFGGVGTKVNGYTYYATTSVVAVNPTKGPAKGGTLVSITGTGFGSAQGSGSVSFGSVPAASIQSWSATLIRVHTPVMSAGLLDVSVTNDGGITGTKASAYQAISPPIASVSVVTVGVSIKI